MMQQEFQETAENLTSQQCEIVFQALDAMMESPHFSKSKRYPALLQYVVSKTISGEQGELKERVIGVQLFGRPADYDTGSDPVVRVVLNELRKRLSIYNSEHPDLPVVIELPIGGYGAHFTFQSPSASGDSTECAKEQGEALEAHSSDSLPASSVEPDRTGRGLQWAKRYRRIAPIAALSMLLLVLLGFLYHAYKRSQCGIWCSAKDSDSQALIVLGKTLDSKYSPVLSSSSPEQEGENGSRHKVSLGSTMAVGDICAVYGALRKPFRIRPADRVFMADLYNRPVVLVGESNSNPWIERLQGPLRYQINPSASGIIEIVDRKSPQNSVAWSAQIDPQTKAILTDYAVLAKFHSSTTDNDVVLIGGLNGFGVGSAAEIATSQESFRAITSMAPKGWKDGQFEAVLRIDVLQGHPGHVQVISAYFW